jgi:hypothetical protein
METIETTRQLSQEDNLYCLEYTIPIGEVPFVSKITNETGYLPVSLSMMASRAKNVPLVDISTLLEKRVLRSVKTGLECIDIELGARWSNWTGAVGDLQPTNFTSCFPLPLVRCLCQYSWGERNTYI